LGARVIEKHFCLSRDEGGVDSAFSLEPVELKQLVQETERAWQGLGEVFYGPTDAEQASLRFRRSLYVARDIPAGTILDPENLRIVRPGYGLHPRHYETMLGRRVNRDISKGTPLSLDLVT
jgi:N-acetylneuraminate synthase